MKRDKRYVDRIFKEFGSVDGALKAKFQFEEAEKRREKEEGVFNPLTGKMAFYNEATETWTEEQRKREAEFRLSLSSYKTNLANSNDSSSKKNDF